MASVSTSCCLNVSPPCLNISSSDCKGSQAAWARDDNWRKRCVLGVACMQLIGMSQAAGDINSTNAIAEEISIVTKSNSSRVDGRWSDKRLCPPWRVNSLETIVPENLPRPSSAAHRKWAAVGFSMNAPAVEVATIRKTKTSSCFSM